MNKDNKILKAGIGYIIGNYLLKGLSFLTIPIFSRLMSTSDYGLYNTFIAYESVLYILMGFAIHSSYKNAKYRYNMANEKGIKENYFNSYVSTTMVLLVISASIWLMLATAFSDVFVLLLKIDKYSVFLLILYSFGSAVITCYNTYVGINYQYKNFLQISAINAVSSVTISVILMCTILSNQRYISRVIGVTIPALILAIFILKDFLNIAKPRHYKSFINWGLKYSLPIIPHGISQVILSQFDRIMIHNMLDSSSAGVYSFAYNIYSILGVTAVSLDNVWNPWFYEQMHIGNLENIKKKSTQYIVMMMLVSSGILLIGPEIVLFLGGDKYWESSYCVIPIVAAGFFSFLYTIPASIEYYYEKTKYIAIGTMTAAIINIVLNFIGISKFGYVAAAYTTLFTYILYFIFHYRIAIYIAGVCVFSTKVILCCSCVIIILSIFARFLINVIWIRWIAALIVFYIFVSYEEHNLKLITRLWKEKNINKC